MPVLITGATGTVGRALTGRLLEEGGQVRAYVRRDDAALRAAGVHTAVGAADDVPRLESALTRVHTIVHLVGGLFPEPGSSYDLLNRDTVEAAVIAARAAEVRRFVFLSFPGADPDSSNEFLAAKGRAEQHILAAGLEHAIFRCAPILGGEQLARVFARRGPVVAVPGDGAQRWNPIGLDDVVDALVAADARESEVRGTWELGGPEALTLDQVADRVGAGSPRVHRGAGPKAVAEVFARETLVDASAAIAQFGLRLSR